MKSRRKTARLAQFPLAGGRWAALLLIFALALTACAPAVTEAPPAEEPAAPPEEVAPEPVAECGPKCGGILTLTGYDPDTHDTIAPAYWEAGIVKSFTHIKLTRWDFSDPLGNPLDREPTPDLAESWDISDDGLTITFHLRQGVRWPNVPPVNGREVVASDVVFSYNRYIDPSNVNIDQLGPVESVEATDDYTVVFTFSAQPLTFLTNTAQSFNVIEAPEVLEEFGSLDSSDSVIGAGPWMLVEYEPGVKQVFERNPDYYRGSNGITGEFLPYIDGVEVLFVEDDPAKLALYRDGAISVGPAYYYWGYWTGDPEQVAALEDRPDLTADFREFAEATTAVHRLQPKVDRFPFDNQKIRQAVSMVLDRSAEFWVSQYGGFIESRELSSAHPWFLPLSELGEGAQFYPLDADGNPTKDFEGANQLMAQAREELGLAPDERIQTEIWVNTLETVFEDWAAVAKADLAEIGIDLEIKVMEWAEYQTKIWEEADYEGMAFEWTTEEFGDPSEYFIAHYVPGKFANIGGVDDAEITELAQAAVQEMDPDARAEMVRELQRILAVKQYEWQVPNWATFNLYPEYLQNVGPQKASEAGSSFLEAWLTEDAPSR